MDTSPIEIDVHSVQKLKNTGAEFELLDCREPAEFEIAAIESARLFPMGDIQQRVNELEPYRAQRIVVLCHLGVRSLVVAEWLRQQGFSEAQSMAGGIDAWSIEIDPSLPRY